MIGTAVVVQGLGKRFHRPNGWRRWGRQMLTALDGIDLEVQRGELFGLLGPNGAGKTTLIKILCGLVLPDRGLARVNGLDVVQQSLLARRHVGVVYGDERTFQMRLSARENLLFFAALYGIPSGPAKRRVDEVLELTDLGPQARVRMHHLSSGYKQRVAIARGLIHDPEVLFMDEPTRSLDPLAAEELHKLILHRIASGGRTVVLATHLMGEAEALCDRLALIDRGHTLHVGTVAELRALVSADAHYEIVFHGGRPGWERGLPALPGVLVSALEHVGDSRHQVDLTIDRRSPALSAVIRYLVDQGGDIVTCTRREVPLDEVFRAVVRTRRAALAEVGI